MATSPIDQNTLLQIAQQKAQQTNPAMMSPNPVLNQIRQQPQQPTGPAQIQHPESFAPQPITPPPSTAQQRLTALTTHKPALENVYGDITQSKLGQAHPVLGKILGGLAQVPASIADIGLSAVAPRIGGLVPGTSANQAAKVQNNMGLVKEEGAQREQAARAGLANAQAGAIPSEIGVRNATAGHLNEETAEMPGAAKEKQQLTDAQIENLLHPQAKTDFEAWRQQNPNEPVETWLNLQNQSKLAAKGPKEQLQKELSDEEAKPQPDKAKITNLRQRLKDIDPLGEQRLTVQVQGQQNANQRAVDARTEREYQYTRTKWDKDLETYNKQRQNLQEAEAFVGRGAMGDAIGSIKSLSGLASGQGSGVRITQAELNSLAHARGYAGDFQAFMQKFGDGRNLTRQQETELKGILTSIDGISKAKETVLNRGLDDLGNANDIPSIRKIDSQIRHVLMGGS